MINTPESDQPIEVTGSQPVKLPPPAKDFFERAAENAKKLNLSFDDDSESIFVGNDDNQPEALEQLKNTMDEIHQLNSEYFLIDLRDVFANPQTRDALKRAVEKSGLPDGIEIHDYMQFGEVTLHALAQVVTEGAMEIADRSIEADEIPVSPQVSTILADDKHPNWLNEIEVAFKAAQDKQGQRQVVLISFGKNFHGTEMFTVQKKIEERMSAYPDWQIVHEPTQAKVLAPSHVDEGIWGAVVERVMCLAKT